MQKTLKNIETFFCPLLLKHAITSTVVMDTLFKFIIILNKQMSDNRYQRFRATCTHILQVLPRVILKVRMLEMSLPSDRL